MAKERWKLLSRRNVERSISFRYTLISFVFQQLSPYSEQWYELDQLKASVRSLSQAAGLPHSPQPQNEDSETLASGLSSGSVSVETLDEVGLEETGVVPPGETTPTGRLSFVTLSNYCNIIPHNFNYHNL